MGHSGNALVPQADRSAMMRVMDQLANEICWPVQAAWLGIGLRGWGRFTSRGRLLSGMVVEASLLPSTWALGEAGEGRVFQGLAMGLPGSPSEDPHSQESDDQGQAQPVTRVRLSLWPGSGLKAQH